MGVETDQSERIEVGEEIVDSDMTLEEALEGPEIPDEIRETLTIVSIRYQSMDGVLHRGQLVVHAAVAREVVEIFEELLRLNFAIEVARPIVVHGWDDNASMAANNTSAFNYRVIAGTDRLSNHSFGLAIDVNPRLNPYMRKDGTVLPEGATYDPEVPGTLTAESDAVRAFTNRGWEWGGDWDDPKDWQHFEKQLGGRERT